MDTNGQPDGYRAPIHLALTRGGVFIAGVQREVLGVWICFSLGLGMVFKSYGAIGLYVVGHAVLAYLSWRDPLWPKVVRESLQYRLRLMSQQERTRLMAITLAAMIGFLVVLRLLIGR
jgi:type IV secretory pathway TrbD component